MEKLTLEKISTDLFDIYESEISFQNQLVPTSNSLEDRSTQYVTKLTKDLEITGVDLDRSNLDVLLQSVTKDIIPAYQAFREKKGKIESNAENRTLWKYVAATVVGLNIIELVVTKGRSLSPGLFFPALLAESAIGSAFYAGAKFKDKIQIHIAKKQFKNTVNYSEKRLLTDTRYKGHQEIFDGDLMDAEKIQLLNQYESSKKFWTDYALVIEENPSSKRHFDALEVPQFESFLEIHLKGGYSSEKIQARYNRLFIGAHEFFMNRDSSKYVLNNLNDKK